jgi:hypothetical protein
MDLGRVRVSIGKRHPGNVHLWPRELFRRTRTLCDESGIGIARKALASKLACSFTDRPREPRSISDIWTDT